MNGSQTTLTLGERQERYWRRCGYKGGLVYVLEVPPLTAIKVGYTDGALVSRISGLQTGCPYPLKARCVVPASQKLETWIHYHMRPLRTCGEWFDGPAVSVHLEKLEGMAGAMRDAHAGGPEPPPFEPFAGWISRRVRRRPGKYQPVTVRHVDPATLRDVA